MSPCFLLLFVIASISATEVSVDLYTGTMFVAGIYGKLSDGTIVPFTTPDGEGCAGVAVGDICHHTLKQDEQFCVSILTNLIPESHKELYFVLTCDDEAAAEITFWGTTFNPIYKNPTKCVTMSHTWTGITGYPCSRF
jgi:hypothetical protein